jgi:predicted nucleic acid-binding protein
MNLVDTSGWIEFLFDGQNASVFAAAIEETSELIVPVICLYEVFKKVNVVADEARALHAVAQMKQGHVVDVTEEIALRAALISLKHRLPMADSLILSTAWAKQANLLTQDEHFAGIPGVNYTAARTSASNAAARKSRRG